ncbi:class I mannose-6-phosphate isomerase [uncultured Bacteroides sp.]|uniref:class I mannose-6-phosphate isomerase n=1 Tax=uncultured Bacteroides sp. TaxID=162156 RepID=UPI002AABEFCF|nr:class I mannose-6-phosphate isomerase [uncultured Bacteroides sp.]
MEYQYDKTPYIPVGGILINGWEAIVQTVSDRRNAAEKNRFICCIECYQGVYLDEFERHIKLMGFDCMINVTNLYKCEKDIREMTASWVTEDELFGKKSPLSFNNFFDKKKVHNMLSTNQERAQSIIVFGPGAACLFPDVNLMLYADMPRWEIQQRQRGHKIGGLGVNNAYELPSKQYKRGYFVDWDICDSLKKELLPIADYWIDSTVRELPKMIQGDTLRDGLKKAVRRPFRVVPFFDPAPWGGQWMKDVCGLDKSNRNYGWCFDCVPEENSLYFQICGELFEIPANNLVFYCTKELLGDNVEHNFGQSFPIRFDFLDTMGGGNLSLQVHPTPQYIRNTFGIPYTQDESYYLLDAGKDAFVYLGLKTDVNSTEMIDALNKSHETGEPFDADRFINKWPANKHDHFLIPGGTIHCSGANAMVLEISATPSIFTFKLYDWGRMGIDGRPRPINIAHGANVIQWCRQTEEIKHKFINQIETVAEGNGWIEERTGLHEAEFIETRRHWFSKAVTHDTSNNVNVLNLIEGSAAIVESPSAQFEPFIVHYAETFIVPAAVGEYTIRPFGDSCQRCGTIKAYIR